MAYLKVCFISWAHTIFKNIGSIIMLNSITNLVSKDKVDFIRCFDLAGTATHTLSTMCLPYYIGLF